MTSPVTNANEKELDMIFSNAEKFRQVVKDTIGVRLDYSLEGVSWVDGFINRNRDRWDDETRKNYLFAIGAYLGESIRRTLKGQWVRHPDFGLGVKSRTGIDFPFNKTGKHIHGGEGDSILNMFTSTIHLNKSL